uniref:SOAR domain-containing protein n=1 Tax=Macrostomum lignano TaxID=282301 RepID=A0A1I8FRP6_9PLAT
RSFVLQSRRSASSEPLWKLSPSEDPQPLRCHRELWTLLLQLTWESELRYCRQNWQQAELRLAKASEGLERLRRKQNSAIGVLRGAFNSAEMVGTFEMSIAEAK